MTPPADLLKRLRNTSIHRGGVTLRANEMISNESGLSIALDGSIPQACKYEFLPSRGEAMS
jgi:hypothetical protein